MIGSGSRAATLSITLGIFLKLLGFFVIMFCYADFEPNKVKQAEYSLQRRFNIALPFPTEKSGADSLSPHAVQEQGRSYHDLQEDLKAEFDFFSSQTRSNESELILELNADQIFGSNAKSPNFAAGLTKMLEANTTENYVFNVEIVAVGGEADEMMSNVGSFVQKMIVAGFPQKYLTIGYESGKKPLARFIVKAVKP
jgi:hypothetical protein